MSRVVDGWLASKPDRPIRLGSSAAKNALKALLDGWSSTAVRALSARPLALTELDRLIPGMNYPSLERRLVAMRLAGLISPTPGNGRGTPYWPTAWLRGAVAPLLMGIRWEQKHLRQSAPPLTKLDVEATFLLPMPMLRLSSEISGTCRMTIGLPNGSDQDLAGVLVEVEGGRVVSCVSRLGGEADAWASGTASAWLAAALGWENDRLEVGGACDLAMEIVDAFHRTLLPTAGQRAERAPLSAG
jgi:DNA-binding HxlR family transcriptional regulator